MKVFSLVAMLLGAAVSSGAQVVTDAPSMAVIELILANDCVMSESDAAQIFPAAGFERQQVRQITRDLIEQGILELYNERLVLVDARCSSGGLSYSGPVLPPLVALQERYIFIMQLRDCTIAIEDMAEIFPNMGKMPIELAYELEEGLINRGVLHASSDGLSLEVGPDYCLPMASFALPAFFEPSEFQAEAIEVLAHQSCRFKLSEIDTVFPAGEFNRPEIERGIGQMLEADYAQMTIGNDIIAISPLVCVPWSFRQ